MSEHPQKPARATAGVLSGVRRAWRLLLNDRSALIAFLYLSTLVLASFALSEWWEAASKGINLQQRNQPPFAGQYGFYFLGSDSLGRPMLPRLLQAASSTLSITLSAVFASLIAGSLLGFLAGQRQGRLESLIIRMADVLMSFPSLLMAVIVLYALDPAKSNLILVLTITRMPVFIRVARAESLAIRERLFVRLRTH